jgi:hypothetical protein
MGSKSLAVFTFKKRIFRASQQLEELALTIISAQGDTMEMIPVADTVTAPTIGKTCTVFHASRREPGSCPNDGRSNI